MFVASLSYLLVFFLIVLGRPVAPGPWRGAVAFDVLLFSIFALHHSLMPREGAKGWFARHAAAELERSAYVWIASVLLFVVCSWWQPVPGTIYSITGAWRWVLYAVQLGGILLVVRASARLDVLELAGIRQVQRAGRVRRAQPAAIGLMPSPADSASLQLRGPYTIVRHPIYLGWVVLVFCTPHMTANRLTFAVVSVVYLVIGTLFEERSLVNAFGESYREYQRRVRWRIVPGVF